MTCRKHSGVSVPAAQAGLHARGLPSPRRQWGCVFGRFIITCNPHACIFLHTELVSSGQKRGYSWARISSCVPTVEIDTVIHAQVSAETQGSRLVLLGPRVPCMHMYMHRHTESIMNSWYCCGPLPDAALKCQNSDESPKNAYTIELRKPAKIVY